MMRKPAFTRGSGLSVTLWLIIINICIFLWQMTWNGNLSQVFTYSFALTPSLFTGRASADFLLIPPLATLVSYQFLHGGLLHILFNMFTLFFFGRPIEKLFGGKRFLLLYLLGGITAGLAQVYAMPSSTIPTIGASGAVAAIIATFVLFYPREHLTIFIYFIPVSGPAYLFIGGWFVFQIFAGLNGSGGVAWWAHIGGFLAGILLTIFIKPQGLRFHYWFATLDPQRKARHKQTRVNQKHQQSSLAQKSSPSQKVLSSKTLEQKRDWRAYLDGYISKSEYEAKWAQEEEESPDNHNPGNTELHNDKRRGRSLFPRN